MSKIIMNLETSKQELNMWIIDVLKLIKDFSLKIKMTHSVSEKDQWKEPNSWTYSDENVMFCGYKITGRMKCSK